MQTIISSGSCTVLYPNNAHVSALVVIPQTAKKLIFEFKLDLLLQLTKVA